jgi:hypothetical protein
LPHSLASSLMVISPSALSQSLRRDECASPMSAGGQSRLLTDVQSWSARPPIATLRSIQAAYWVWRPRGI